MANTDPAQPERDVTELAERLLPFSSALSRTAQLAESDGDLAAKMYFDAWLTASGQRPGADTYLALAADTGRAGWSRQSALLAKLAGIDADRELEQRRWDTRYATRYPTLRDVETAELIYGGNAAFDPDGPYAGSDGSLFLPGHVEPDQSVLVVTGRGLREPLTGWGSYAEMRQWLADRGTTGTYDLNWPGPVAASRMAKEERLLARMVTYPHEIPRLSRGLSPAAFTTDVRYDIYLALLSAAADPGRYATPAVEEMLAQRAALLPRNAQRAFGGPDAMSARHYVRRLAATDVSRSEAEEASMTILEEDSSPYAAGELTPGTSPAPGTPSSRRITVVAGQSAETTQSPNLGQGVSYADQEQGGRADPSSAQEALRPGW